MDQVKACFQHVTAVQAVFHSTVCHTLIEVMLCKIPKATTSSSPSKLVLGQLGLRVIT